MGDADLLAKAGSRGTFFYRLAIESAGGKRCVTTSVGPYRRRDASDNFPNQSVEVFEIRPAYQRPGEIMENAVARATYVKSTNAWKIYWRRADLKWHRYDPLATVPTIEDFIAEVDRDPYGCFFG